MAIDIARRVTIEEDVVFGTGGGRDLKCDVYTPPGGPASAPAVLLVHGGGWSNGDRKQLRGYGILPRREGYPCVASAHRPGGEGARPPPSPLGRAGRGRGPRGGEAGPGPRSGRSAAANAARAASPSSRIACGRASCRGRRCARSRTMT